MKKGLLSILILTLISCGGGSVGSDDEKGFVHTPDSLEKKTVPFDVGEVYSLNFNGAKTENYAIIYKGEIDETSYVGIAVSYDPSLETTDASYFNLKIYFPSDSIEVTNYQFDNSHTTSIVKAVEGPVPTTYQFGNGLGSGTMDITITLEEETETYKTYRIQQTGNIQLSGTQLDNVDIIALCVGE